MRTRRKLVLIVGPLPPPLHGASAVTYAALVALEGYISNSRFELRSHSTSAISLQRSFKYHAMRLLVNVTGILKIARSAVYRDLTIYIGGSGGVGLWYQLVMVLLTKVFNRRVIFHHHSYRYLGSRRSLPMRAINRVMGENDTHIVLTIGMGELFQELYRSSAKVEVVSNAAFVPLPDPTYYTRPRTSPVGPPRLVHVSNLSIEKGTGTTIEAAIVLIRLGFNVRLDLVGPCMDPSLKGAIDAAVLLYPENIRYLGEMSPAGVAEVLQDASVFIFPSRYHNEAQPLVVIEALRAGVPVVASDYGALEELLPAKWIVRDVGPQNLAERIQEVIEKDWELSSSIATSIYHESNQHSLNKFLTTIIS